MRKAIVILSTLVLAVSAPAPGEPAAAAETEPSARKNVHDPASPTAQASQPATTSAPASRPAATQPAPAEAVGFFRALGRAVSKIGWYFGPVGVASILAWMLVWAVLAAWSARTKGMGLCLGTSFLAGLAVVYAYSMPEVGDFVAFVVWLVVFAALLVVVLWAILEKEIPVAFAALILSIAAFGLGMWNSDNVAGIQLDRRAALAAARRRQMEARQREVRKLKSKAADIHFAEDDGNDALDMAGHKEKDAKKIADANADAPDYAYRKSGKRTRDARQIDKNNVLAKAVQDAADESTSLGGGAKFLPGADYMLANQLDKINRFAVRLTLVVALILAAIEYLRRFNLTFGSILPMPIACRTVDSLWPKAHTVYLHAPGGRTVRDYLETVVQKGESFLYFAAADPWPGEDVSLARLPIGGLWPLRKIVCRPGDAAYGSGFVFESAWFGRYCFVILAEGLDEPLSALLGDLLDKLRMRRHTRATAPRTVSLVWDLPTPPPAEALRELAFLCRETNLKLVLTSATPPVPEVRELFEEVHTA